LCSGVVMDRLRPSDLRSGRIIASDAVNLG
jgi:hypothetical protein